MYQLGSDENSTLSRVLKEFHRKAVVSRCAGLLTVPAFHANTIRIETLVHLAVAYCGGKRKPTFSDVGRWLNRNLGNSAVSSAEDPPEDVFVSNICTAQGNFRLFEGTWESNDFHLQHMLDTAESLSLSVPPIAIALQRVYALLRLGDVVAARLNLLRWHAAPSSREGNLTVGPNTNIDTRAAAVTFSIDDLYAVGIEPGDLEPFLFTEADRATLSSQVVTQGTALELRPLVPFGDEYVLALPAGVGSALRSYILREVVAAKAFSVFEKALSLRQASLVRQLLRRMEDEYESLLSSEKNPELPQIQSWCFVRDTNQHVHVVVLHEDLKECVDLGWGVTRELGAAQQSALDDFLQGSTVHCEKQPNFKHGTTLVIFAGVGRALSTSLPRLGDSWDILSLGLADLDMLVAYCDDALEQLFKFRHQAAWVTNKGAKYFNFGDFSLFCQWVQDDFSIWPRDLPLREGSVYMVPPSSVLDFRKNVRRSRDKHSIQTWSGKWMVCERYGRNSFFDSQTKRPIFVCMEVIEHLMLAAAVETVKGTRWLICVNGGFDANKRKYVFRLWSDFLNSFAEVALFIDENSTSMRADVLEVFLDCTMMVDVESAAYSAADATSKDAAVVEMTEGRAEVRLPVNFFAGFQQVENGGERALISVFVRALEKAANLTIPFEAEFVERAVNVALPSDGARLIHLFSSKLKSDHLIWSASSEPRWLNRADAAFVRLNLANAPPTNSKVVNGKEACTEILNEYVSSIWEEIKLSLNGLDLSSLLKATFFSNEAIYSDRIHWRRTARAVLSLNENGEGLDAAFTQEQKRNRTSLATRVLAEMALCECAVEGGALVTDSEFDLLAAKVSLLIEVASDSDAIRGKLAPGRLTIYPNGEYEIDRSYQATIMQPFVENQYNDEYQDAAGEYSQYYENKNTSGKSKASDVYSQDFLLAFEAEYRLSPDELIDCFAELSDFATDIGQVVVVASINEIKRRIGQNRGLSQVKCDAFVKAFSLVRRPKWEKAPKGFAARDIWPWLFKRRLSIIVRPVVSTGASDSDTAYFGISQILQSLNYLLGRSSKAWMPQDFFVSQEMKAFSGKTAHALGGVFEDDVVRELNANGWEARARVQMSELGAPRELGDVDVLAWRPDGRVLIIECKRLQPARTVGEVADVLQKFAGEEKDKLARHLRRLSWLQASPSGVPRALRLDKAAIISSIQGRLVTNTDVPMMYAKDLPILVSEIIPTRLLKTI